MASTATILIIAGLIIAGFFIFGQDPEQFIETNLFDSDGNLINGNALSVVGGVEGVAFVSFDVNIRNLDNVPLTFELVSITPASVSDALPTGQINVQPDETGTFTTSLIDIQTFEGMVQEFCITAESQAIPALRESSQKMGCVSLDIQPNPEGDFDVNVDSDLEEPGENPGCTESWSCSEWGTCVGNIQTRTCIDSNSCGTTQNLPEEEQFCEGDTFQTNAVDGNYNEPGVFIILNEITYNRGGISSYVCPLPENIIFTTPEGFSICSRPPYLISQRVYLHDGFNGIIFEA